MAKKLITHVKIVEYAAIPSYPAGVEEQDDLRAAAEKELGKWLADEYDLVSTAVGSRANAMTVVWTLVKSG